MKKIFIGIFTFFSICSLSSCKQAFSRQFGGDITIEVPKGQKVTMATWKNTDLFYMTEDMEDGDVPKKKYLRESSTIGVIESTVTFIESK